jgi:opacity protein-like surface antigen
MRGQFFSCRASVGAASAADLPMKGVPYAAPPPVFGWTGFHIGGHAGAGVLLDRGFRSQGSLLNGPEALADRHGISGLAGGQIGYNWQMVCSFSASRAKAFGQARSVVGLCVHFATGFQFFASGVL